MTRGEAEDMMTIEKRRKNRRRSAAGEEVLARLAERKAKRTWQQAREMKRYVSHSGLPMERT